MAGILGEGETETTYKDSNIFLKGTQSANPHNDYSQHFIDIGQRPQNFIRDVGKRAELSLGSMSGGVHSADERQCFPQRRGSLVPRLSLLKEKESLVTLGKGGGSCGLLAGHHSCDFHWKSTALPPNTTSLSFPFPD